MHCHQGNIFLNKMLKVYEFWKCVEKLCAKLPWVKKLKANVYFNEQANEII